MNFFHVNADTRIGSLGSPLEGSFDHWIERARLEQVRRQVAQGVRADSADAVKALTFNAVFDALVRNENAEYLGAKVRADSGSSASGGVFLADQLTHVYNEVLREEHPVPNGMRLFAVDSSVPFGARSHRVKRLWQDGEAVEYRPGAIENIPRAGVSQVSQDFNVSYYITSIVFDIFDEASANFANFALISEMTRSARDALEAFANLKVWNGSESTGLFGIFNYPWLPKKVLAADFTDAEHTASGGQAILDALLALVEYPAESSKNVFRPTHLAMTQRAYNFIASKPVGTASAHRDSTILERFQKAHPEITIEAGVWELQDFGGTSGLDGLLVYRKDRQGIANVMVGGMGSLPLQKDGFRSMQPFYLGHGGVIMRSVGSNILGLVTVDV